MPFNPRWIIGRRIVAVAMNPFPARDNGRETAHAPVITLDNGAKLLFHVEETDGTEYGVDFIYRKP